MTNETTALGAPKPISPVANAPPPALMNAPQSGGLFGGASLGSKSDLGVPFF